MITPLTDDEADRLYLAHLVRHIYRDCDAITTYGMCRQCLRRWRSA